MLVECCPVEDWGRGRGECILHGRHVLGWKLITDWLGENARMQVTSCNKNADWQKRIVGSKQSHVAI